MKLIGKVGLVKVGIASFVVAGLAAALVMHALNGSDPYPRTASGYGVLANASNAPAAKPVEVTDFFFYACPHCSEFNQPLEAWIAHEGDRIHVRRLPVGSAPILMRHQRLYYALDELGQAERLRDAIYSAIHEKHEGLESDDEIVRWVAAHGVDATEFRRAYASAEVTAKVVAGQAELARARIGSVPSVVIGNEWVVSPTTAGGVMQALPVMTGRVDATLAGEKLPATTTVQ